MAEETKSAVGYFDELVGRSDEEEKAQQVALARRLLKRKFASAYDSAEGQILKKAATVSALFGNIRRAPQAGVETFDINNYIALQQEITALEAVRETTKKEYERLFGEPLLS